MNKFIISISFLHYFDIMTKLINVKYNLLLIINYLYTPNNKFINKLNNLLINYLIILLRSLIIKIKFY